jgi:Autotransporter beta-domain
MYKFVTLAIAASALVGLCSWSVPALAQSAEEEVAKQTARQISDAISKRVGEDVGVVYAAPGAQGMAAESGEFLNSAWATLTYNRVDFEGGTFGGSDGLNIFLGTVGFDHRFDNFIPGISVTGAHAKVDDVNGSSDGATVSPYLGYIVNDWFFVNALVGVSLSNSDIGGTDSDSTGVFTEEDANVVWHDGNWLATGKAGHRFRHSRDHEDGFGSTDSDANTLLAGGKVGYRIDTVRPYLGAQYEYNFNVDEEDDDFLYLLIGFAMVAGPHFSMDLSGQAEVIDPDTTAYSVTWQGVYRF